jgi:hypothetical protein
LALPSKTELLRAEGSLVTTEFDILRA